MVKNEKMVTKPGEESDDSSAIASDSFEVKEYVPHKEIPDQIQGGNEEDITKGIPLEVYVNKRNSKE